jgi:hypothetical protein
MAMAATVTAVTKLQNTFQIAGTIVPSGSYVAGGDTVNLLTATYGPGQTPPPTQSVPLSFQAQSFKTAGATTVYSYSGVNGATIGALKLQVLVTGSGAAPSAELAAGAYPAGVSGDTITFQVEVPSL